MVPSAGLSPSGLRAHVVPAPPLERARATVSLRTTHFPRTHGQEVCDLSPAVGLLSITVPVALTWARGLSLLAMSPMRPPIKGFRYVPTSPVRRAKRSVSNVFRGPIADRVSEMVAWAFCSSAGRAETQGSGPVV